VYTVEILTTLTTSNISTSCSNTSIMSKTAIQLKKQRYSVSWQRTFYIAFLLLVFPWWPVAASDGVSYAESHTVVRGDSLYVIAEAFYSGDDRDRGANWLVIYHHNVMEGLIDPREQPIIQVGVSRHVHLSVGQTLIIPFYGGRYPDTVTMMRELAEFEDEPADAIPEPETERAAPPLPEPLIEPEPAPEPTPVPEPAPVPEPTPVPEPAPAPPRPEVPLLPPPLPRLTDPPVLEFPLPDVPLPAPPRITTLDAPAAPGLEPLPMIELILPDPPEPELEPDPEPAEILEDPSRWEPEFELFLAPGMAVYADAVGLTVEQGLAISVWDLMVGLSSRYDGASIDDFSVSFIGSSLFVGYPVEIGHLLPFTMPSALTGVRVLPRLSLGGMYAQRILTDRLTYSGFAWHLAPGLVIDAAFRRPHGLRLGLSTQYNIYFVDTPMQNFAPTLYLGWEF
jgi:hypothetical protein